MENSPHVVVLALFVAAATGAVAQAQPVTGRVVLETPAPPPPTKGYTRMRVARPSAVARPASRDHSVFLEVVESLPLDAPPPAVVALSGLRLEPSVVSCAVDGIIRFENHDREPATFVVADQSIGAVSPGGAVEYECVAGSGVEMRSVRVREWPRVRGSVFVGEVGAPGTLDERGGFRIVAAKGTYRLQIVGRSGVVGSVPVKVDGRAVDLGTINPREERTE